MKKEEKSDDGRKKMRSISCPKCGWRIMTALPGIKLQFITPTKSRYPDFVLKCGHCGTEIGVIKTEKKT